MDGNEFIGDVGKNIDTLMVYIDNRPKEVETPKLEIATQNLKEINETSKKEMKESQESYASVIEKNPEQADPLVKEILKPKKRNKSTNNESRINKGAL